MGIAGELSLRNFIFSEALAPTLAHLN